MINLIKKYISNAHKKAALLHRFIALNHLKVFTRILFRNYKINFQLLSLKGSGKTFKFHIPIEGRVVKAVYSGDKNLKINDYGKFDIIMSTRPNQKIHFKKYLFQVVRNRNSSIRWVFNQNEDFQYLFDVFSTTKPKKILLKILLKLSIFKYFLSRDFYIYVSDEVDRLIISRDFSVVYAGIIGANHKTVIYNQDSKYEYIKLPIGENAINSLQNELRYFEFISNTEIKKFIPNFKSSGDGLAVSKLNGVINTNEDYRSPHHSFLLQLMKLNCQNSNTFLFQKAKSFFKEFNSPLEEHEEIFFSYVNKFSKLKLDNISTSLAHGDFTPWNVTLNDDYIMVYDWEMAFEDAPMYFDFFHYIYYGGVLVKHLNFDQINDKLNFLHGVFFKEVNISDFIKYHFLYVYIQSYNHFKALQISNDDRLMQSAWLIKAWSDAMFYFEKKLLEV